MNVYDIMFTLGFLGCILLTVAGLYVILKKYWDDGTNKKRDFGYSLLSFIGYLFSWMVCLVVFLAEPETVIYYSLFPVTSWLILLNLMFLIVSVMCLWTTTPVRKAYKSLERL